MSCHEKYQSFARSAALALEPWPRFMRAATAARYVDEVSVRAFLRKVGRDYPCAVAGKGRCRRWDRNQLDLFPAVAMGGATASLADDL